MRQRCRHEIWTGWREVQAQARGQDTVEDDGTRVDCNEMEKRALRGRGSAVLAGDSRPAVAVEGIGVLVALVMSGRLPDSNYHQELYF